MHAGKVCLCILELLLPAIAQPPAGWVENIQQGLSLQSQGRFTAAESRFESALQEAERISDQPDLLAATLSYLAEAEIDLGRLDEATRLCQRAISILVKSAGEADGRVQMLRTELASLYLESGQLATAEKLLREIISFQAREGLTASPEAAFTLDALACLYVRQRKLAAAEAVERRSLSVLGALPEPDLASVAVGNLHLSIFLNARKKPKEALVYAERARTMFQALPLPKPVMEAAADMSLASIHAGLGRPADAEAESRRALETVENIYRPNDPQTAWLLLARAAVLRRLDRKKEARVIQKQGESILWESGGNQLGETVPVEALLPH